MSSTDHQSTPQITNNNVDDLVETQEAVVETEREKITQLSLADIGYWLDRKEIKNVIVVSGAGVSVSAGVSRTSYGLP